MSFNPTSLQGFGIDLGERAPVSLKDRFVIPPFSVLRVMDGDWMNRKQAWLRLGIKSEVGRGLDLLGGLGSEENRLAMYAPDEYRKRLAVPSGSPRPMSRGWGEDHPQESVQKRTRKANATPSGSPRPACDYSKGERGDGAGKPASQNGILFKSQDRLNEIMGQGKGKKHPTAMAEGLTFGEMPNYDGSNRNAICGTSIFDPVLCELAYRWWCPAGGSNPGPVLGRERPGDRRRHARATVHGHRPAGRAGCGERGTMAGHRLAGLRPREAGTRLARRGQSRRPEHRSWPVRFHL